MKYLSWIILIVSLTNCEDAPQTSKPSATLGIISGNEQTGKTGNYLTKPIELAITSRQDSKLWMNGFAVFAKITKGNGFVSSQSSWQSTDAFTTDLSGKFKIDWSLGCDVLDQSVTFYLYHISNCPMEYVVDNLCNPIDSVTINATALIQPGWNKTCGLEDTDETTGEIRIINNQIYLLNHQKLYRADVNKLLSWKRVEEQPNYRFYHYGINSMGWLYFPSNGVVTLFKGKNDLTELRGGLNGAQDPIAILVEDTVIYTSFFTGGIYRLRQGNSIWQKLLIGGNDKGEVRTLVRHPNGNLYAIDKWGTYWVSSNYGDSWNAVGAMNKYINYNTEDIKIHSSGLLYIGSWDGTLAIVSPTGDSGEVHKHTGQLVTNILFNKDHVQYLVTDPDYKIHSSSTDWKPLITSFDKKVRWFGHDTQGNLILCADDGIYYYNE